METAAFWLSIVALLFSVAGIVMTILLERVRQPELEVSPQQGGVGDEEGYRKIHLLIHNRHINRFWGWLGFQRYFAEDCSLQIRIRRSEQEIIKDWFNLAASEYPDTYKFRVGPNPQNPVPVVVGIKFKGHEEAFALSYDLAHKKVGDNDIKAYPIPNGIFLVDVKLTFGSMPQISEQFQLSNPDTTLQQFTLTKQPA